MAKGIGPGDAVFCPSFTFAATAEVVAWFGATPVFVDVVEDTFNLDPASLELAIATARQLEPHGRRASSRSTCSASRPTTTRSSRSARARACGCCATRPRASAPTYRGRKVGTIGEVTTTSFFPAKPLGCYGDGGAIFTDDDELAAVLRSIRVHGQGADKYDNVRIGMNGRLDTIQAAVLIEKLEIFRDEIEARERVAGRYNDLLRDVAIVPEVADGLDLGVGAVHAPHPGSRPRRVPGRPQEPPASRPRSTTRSRCTARPPTSTIRAPATACRSPSASPPR